MWLGIGHAEQGLSAMQGGMVPGILDPSVDGKTLCPIELIVGHLLGVQGHPSIAHSQQTIVGVTDVHTSEQGTDLMSRENRR